MTTPKPPTPPPSVPQGPPPGPQATVSAKTEPAAPPEPKPPTPATEAPTTTAAAPPPSGTESPSPSPSTTTASSSTPTTPSTTEPSTPTSTEEPTPDPDRPKDPGPAALFDAVAAEHAAIYGYGLVSAHVMPDDNELVSQALAQHRDRREAAVALMNDRSLKPPLPAAGYQLPMVVNNASSAAKLAVRLESDCAVAWRAVLEQTDSDSDREFGTKALTQCAVLAARWRKVLGAWPVTEAFPGGSE